MQNQVEGAGLSTISMSVQPHVTASVGVPRGMYIRYPAGNQMGEGGKPQQQRTILTAVLNAVSIIQSPGTLLELPYQWRRFPIQEEPVFPGTSQGARHPQAEAIGEALDTLVKRAQEYKTYLEGRLARKEANAAVLQGLAVTLFSEQVVRLEQLIQTLDTDILDQLREIVNQVATLELRAGGDFV